MYQTFFASSSCMCVRVCVNLKWRMVHVMAWNGLFSSSLSSSSSFLFCFSSDTLCGGCAGNYGEKRIHSGRNLVGL